LLLLYFSRTDLIIQFERKEKWEKKINEEECDGDDWWVGKERLGERLGKFPVGEILSCERYIFFSHHPLLDDGFRVTLIIDATSIATFNDSTTSLEQVKKQTQQSSIVSNKKNKKTNTQTDKQ